MQFDAEARIERALDHALGMDFEHARRGEAAEQRLAHLGRIGARLFREDQRLGGGLDVQRDDDLVGDLGDLAVADRADVGDVLAHQLEQRADALERGGLATAHDRQRGVLGADLAA